MPIKILHIIGQLGVGGCEKQLLEMCRRMDKTRYDVSVCYYTPQKGCLADEFRAVGMNVFSIDKPSIGPLVFFWKLCRLIRQERPDIIHSWLYSPNFWGRLAGWFCGCRRLITSSRSMNIPLNSGSRLIERLTGKYTTWVVNSQAIADAVMKGFSVPLSRMQVVYNAVELAERNNDEDRRDVRRELGFAEDQPIILTVGRLTKAKNYPMLFGVAKEMSRRRNDIRFIVAGHGEEENALRSLVGEMGIGESLRLLGVRGDIPRLLAAADAFCLCSLYEGFPNVVAEALWAGVPTAVTRFDGADEIVQDGVTGRLVDMDDVMAMTDVLEEFIVQPSAAKKLAQNGKSWARTRLSWDRLMNEMDTIYSDVMRR